ncbi:alanine racemase [Frateuria aurantia]
MRPARALIDLQALRANYRLAQRLGGARALAVIKADAYGHGAIACARALEPEADGFAVACIEEALSLRAAGITAPILLLEGFFGGDELELIIRHSLWTVIHAEWQLRLLEQWPDVARIKAWLKLDSGMHRVGFAAADYAAAYRRLRQCRAVADVVCMTHFARADEVGCHRTQEQLASFDAATAGLGAERSLRNSPSLLGWSGPASDWVRPGLMLYGMDPLDHPSEASRQLQPVMTLESKVISVRELPAGEPVGYGAQFVTSRPSRIAVVALGYADGYPQCAPSGTPVRVDGQPAALAGRVSMDMLTVDLTDLPQAGLGSTVELWGRQIPAAEVAARCRTSTYQLMCGVRRVPLRYNG